METSLSGGQAAAEQKTKSQYFAELRASWQAAKKYAETEPGKAIVAEMSRHGIKVSPYGFVFTKMAMIKRGFEGLPVIDAKTFKGWRECGYVVKRGEKCQIRGVTWVHPKAKGADGELEEIDGAGVYPKEYHLFHRSQVEAMHR